MTETTEDDLDDLLPVNDPDDLSDLDASLSKAMGELEAERQYKADLVARKRGFQGMSREEVEFVNSRMAVFEEARIWRTVENIAVFTTFKCLNCGDSRRIFTRWMQKQQSRVNVASRRWLTTAKRNEKVPTIAADELRTTDICTSCAPMLMDTHGSKTLDEALR